MQWLVVGAVVCALRCHFVVVVESHSLEGGPACTVQHGDGIALQCRNYGDWLV